MFDHVTISVADWNAAQRFYDTALPALGIERTASEDWIAEWDDFSLSPAADGKPPTHGLHVGFVAPSRAAVDAFWRAGIDAGYRDDGAPGARPQYGEDYYGAFLLDPDGNSAEAVHHGAMRAGANVDHLWIRVDDVAAARDFYALVAAHAGFELRRDTSDYVQFGGGRSGSFSLLPGPPTEHLHLAFPAPDRATVDAFHRALVGAGYADNGAPGERPIYHPGYYGAFVCAPDGTNVELVHHG